MNVTENNCVPSAMKSIPYTAMDPSAKLPEDFWDDPSERRMVDRYNSLFDEEEPSRVITLDKRIKNFRSKHPRIAAIYDESVYGIGKGLQYSAYAGGFIAGFAAGELINPFGGGFVGGALGFSMVKSLEAPAGDALQYGVIDPVCNWYARGGRTETSQWERRIAVHGLAEEFIPIFGIMSLRGARSIAPQNFYAPAPQQSALLSSQRATQLRLNYQAGRMFQESVHGYLRIPENKTPYPVLVQGKGIVTTIPDLPVLYGITESKNVQYITYTKQLRAQVALAKDRGTSFNLIISPSTEKISKPLMREIYQSKNTGRIFEFNSLTQTMVERFLDGNKVMR